MVAEPSAGDEQTLLDLFNEGRLSEAERLARRLTRRLPAYLFGWKVLAATLAASGQWGAAIPLYERLHGHLAGDWQFLNNFANALKTVGRLDAASQRYREAIALDPSHVEPHYNLALTYIDSGDFDSAETSLQTALMLNPGHGLAHLNLANLQNLRGRLAEAETHYLAAQRAIPSDARLLNNLGQLYSKLHRYAEAEHCIRKSIELDPAYATPVNNLSELMATHGHLAQAELLLRHALQIDPDHAQAHSNLLFTLAHRETVTPEALLKEHRAFAERFEAPLLTHRREHGNSRDPHRSLRLGFVSADLRSHPLMRYLPQALEALGARGEYELNAYSNNPLQDSETERYRRLFSGWRDVFHLSDDALAAQIRADGIDILIDLSGHTGHNRLLAFARRPAPLQVSWMGYVGSTGLACMDYFVADRRLVPAAHEALFTEKLLLLPAATTFAPYPSAPEVTDLPALRSGTFTFACLARANKLSPSLIRRWAQILRGAEKSRLLLATMPDGNPPQTVLRWFGEAGFTASELQSRLQFAHLRNVEELLALHAEIDLALDTFPYNGSTSSSHALWMGVPTLTVAGETTAGRMGVALALHTASPEFIADSTEDYVRRAIGWTRRLPELTHLRARLRSRFADSTLQNHRLLAASLLAGLRTAWSRWCDGLPPETIDVAR